MLVHFHPRIITIFLGPQLGEHSTAALCVCVCVWFKDTGQHSNETVQIWKTPTKKVRTCFTVPLSSLSLSILFSPPHLVLPVCPRHAASQAIPNRAIAHCLTTITNPFRPPLSIPHFFLQHCINDCLSIPQIIRPFLPTPPPLGTASHRLLAILAVIPYRVMTPAYLFSFPTYESKIQFQTVTPIHCKRSNPIALHATPPPTIQ